MIADTKDGYVPAPAGSPLKVYLLTQGVVRDWNTYNSCVVIAASKGDARRIHPSGKDRWNSDEWVSLNQVGKVNVTEIGIANEKQVAGTVVCSSFIAG